VGKLEDIIARNRRPNRPSEKLVVALVFGLIVLLIIVLAVFTDLGLPPDDDRVMRARSAPAVAPQDRKRVDGVLLLRSAPAPAPATPPASR
jgi:hypothetical protein